MVGNTRSGVPPKPQAEAHVKAYSPRRSRRSEGALRPSGRAAHVIVTLPTRAKPLQGRARSVRRAAEAAG